MTFYENCHVLLLLLLRILISAMAHKYKSFKACIFGCIGVKSIELATQAFGYRILFRESLGAPGYL